MKRIGVFSGTFDPVHRGHLAFALAAIKQCNLEKVVFLPEPSPRSLEHRLNMIKLVIQQFRKLSVLALHDSQFTVSSTLPQLRERFKDAQLVLLAGSDVIRTFSFRWPGLEQLLSEVEIAVSLRAGESQSDAAVFLSALPVTPVVTFVEGPHPHLSASEVRAGNLLGIEPAVRRYIENHRLYQEA